MYLSTGGKITKKPSDDNAGFDAKAVYAIGFVTKAEVGQEKHLGVLSGSILVLLLWKHNL